MFFYKINDDLKDIWDNAENIWKDHQATIYKQKCIEPSIEVINGLQALQSSILQTIEEFDSKIKKYE